METILIEYLFKVAAEHEVNFGLELDGHTLELSQPLPDDLPQWARLSYHQCPNCTHDPVVHPFCPLVGHLAPIVKRFEGLLSYDDISLVVTTKERRISQETTAQRAISSLMGLVIAASGCPHTVYFKPMARFHLPLASQEETIYRAASTYLLAQYFRNNDGRSADLKLDGLKQIYRNIETVNLEVAKRLRSASTTDSSVNAIILLDMFAKTLPFVIEESLSEIRYLFAPYLRLP